MLQSNSIFYFVFFYFLDPPKDEGGAEITKYIVELDDGKGRFSSVSI
jgi:hypothetical protein